MFDILAYCWPALSGKYVHLNRTCIKLENSYLHQNNTRIYPVCHWIGLYLRASINVMSCIQSMSPPLHSTPPLSTEHAMSCLQMTPGLIYIWRPVLYKGTSCMVYRDVMYGIKAYCIQMTDFLIDWLWMPGSPGRTHSIRWCATCELQFTSSRAQSGAVLIYG